MSEMINYGVLPNSRVVLIKDNGRHKPNGVATLDSNSLLVEEIEGGLYACNYPSPVSGKNLVQYIYDIITGGQ